MMKKLICIALTVVLCLTVCACQVKAPTTTPTEPSTPVEAKSLSGIVQEVHDDYFVLQTFDDQKEQIIVHVKLDNVKQKPEVCKYDYAIVSYTNRIEPEKEGDPVIVEAASVQIDMIVCEKPIIYLYPEAETQCTVQLNLNGRLTCTYPAYQNGWQFTAKPDGTLVFPDGKEYYALYWEGIANAEWDMSKGFCVKGEDTAEFLEWALAAQGLTAREANEFIVYWLPLMQNNAYNVISFQTDVYTQAAELKVTPAPDSMLRVFMTYYASDEAVEIEPQEFEDFERVGFTVVEWGGSEIK